MQADPVLLQEIERLLNGANVHEGRLLMCRYVTECWLGKRPELVNALHEQLSHWARTERRKQRAARRQVA